MRISKIAVLLFFLTGFGTLYAQSPGYAKLEITFTGFRNSEGQVAIGINSSEKGWPKTPLIELQWDKRKVLNGELRVVVEDMKYGEYAVSVLDDENLNLEMDKRMGIPKEGYGFSNNPKVKMSAPGFEACSFHIDQPVKKITINLKYF